jgi:hypothetical protein
MVQCLSKIRKGLFKNHFEFSWVAEVEQWRVRPGIEVSLAVRVWPCL